MQSWAGEVQGSLNSGDSYAPGDNRLPKSIGMFRRQGKKKQKSVKDEDEEILTPFFDFPAGIVDGSKVIDSSGDKSIPKITDISYDAAYDLYKRLSDKEKNFLAPSGNYVDSTHLLFRVGILDGSKCIGFCDIYHFANPDDPADIDKGVVSIATDPDARGKGVAFRCAKEALQRGSRYGLNGFIYKVNPKNKASIGLAEKLGGKLEKADKDVLRYKIS